MILEVFGRIVIQLSKMSCVRKFFVFKVAPSACARLPFVFLHAYVEIL
jgi:hypothetical protein